MSALLGLVPRWAYALLVVAAMLGAAMLHGRHQGAAEVQARWNHADAVRAEAESAAIRDRLTENTALAVQQAATNAAITKVHNDEMGIVRRKLAAVVRMQLPAFCTGTGGVASPAGADSATRGAAPDPAGGLLPGRTETDLRTVILSMEETAATGRACQAFVRGDGMATPDM